MFILRLTTSLPKLCQSCQSATLAEKKQAFSQMPAHINVYNTKNLKLTTAYHKPPASVSCQSRQQPPW